jgi:predicted phage terminase large subunit-like protein
MRRRVVDQARKFNANTIVIEDKGSGIALIQDLRRGDEHVPYPIAFTPETDKVTRMSAHSAKIEAGQVSLPRCAEWLDELRIELLQFPHGRYDDQVDSISQFLNWIDRRQRQAVSIRYSLRVFSRPAGSEYPSGRNRAQRAASLRVS